MMVRIADIKRSISELESSAAMELVLTIRRLREESKVSTTRKSYKKKAEKSRSFESIIDNMSKEDILALMNKLKGDIE